MKLRNNAAFVRYWLASTLSEPSAGERRRLPGAAVIRGRSHETLAKVRARRG